MVEDGGGGVYFRRLGHGRVSKACIFVVFLLAD